MSGRPAVHVGQADCKYPWSATAYVGVLAQDVMEKVPHAVSTGRGNFLAVNYGALDMAMTLA